MKTIMKWRGVILLILMTHVSFAQIDQKRMDRDLEVAEKILQTLAQQNSEERTFWMHNADATYIEGFGVMLTVPSYFVGRGYAVIPGDKVEVTSKDDRQLTQKELNDKLVEVVKTFLVDYGDLIGQLRPNDKIMVTQKRDREFVLLGELAGGNVLTVNGQNADARKDNRVSVEISKQVLVDFKQGKIGRSEAMNRVVVTENDETAKKMPDLELFASILSRLYKSDLSESFQCSNTPSYEVLPNFGVIYHMRAYSSKGNRLYYSELSYSDNQNNRKDQAKTNQVDRARELYPKFKEEMKRNIIEYGRTIRSLKDGEILMIKVKISSCRNCEIPKSLDLSVKKSVLDQYASGKTNLEAAIGQVLVKEHATN